MIALQIFLQVIGAVIAGLILEWFKARKVVS